MAKTTAEKEKRLKELFQKKEEIQAEIDSMLQPEKVAVLPNDFSVQAEVDRVIYAHPNGIHAKAILSALQTEFPDYGITRKQVNGALTYLKATKKRIIGLGKGVYKPVMTEEEKMAYEVAKEDEAYEAHMREQLWEEAQKKEAQ